MFDDDTARLVQEQAVASHVLEAKVRRAILEQLYAQAEQVVGAREINLGSVPPEQRNWINDHFLYTHGFGLVAARGPRALATAAGATLLRGGAWSRDAP